MKSLLAIVLATILFLSSIVGIVIYYNNALGERDSKISALQTQIENKTSEIESLNNQISNLTNQISSLNSQLANLTGASVRIVNFVRSPSYPVLGITDYKFDLYIQNNGDVVLNNVTVSVKLTLSDNNSQGWSGRIDTLQVGEITHMGYTFEFNSMFLDGQWLVELTTPKGILAQQTFPID